MYNYEYSTWRRLRVPNAVFSGATDWIVPTSTSLYNHMAINQPALVRGIEAPFIDEHQNCSLSWGMHWQETFQPTYFLNDCQTTFFFPSNFLLPATATTLWVMSVSPAWWVVVDRADSSINYTKAWFKASSNDLDSLGNFRPTYLRVTSHWTNDTASFDYSFQGLSTHRAYPFIVQLNNYPQGLLWMSLEQRTSTTRRVQ